MAEARTGVPCRPDQIHAIYPGRFRPPPGKNKLWAVPINSNTELLWYRKDLVPNPPTTWAQMIADANHLAAEGKPHYIEEQGAQYEGLTVWFNSLVNSAGGQILSPDNQVVLGRPAAIAASIMHQLATSKAADPSLNVSQEGPGQVAFQSGTAAFMINYPFVWSATQAGNPKVFKDMGYALFPGVVPGVTPRVSIGGYNLGISAFSKHPNLAFEAVQCLIKPANQSRDAIKGGLAPVAASIYDQPAFEKAYPFHQLIKQQLQNYGIRPQTPAYADVTLAIQKTLSPTSNINPSTVVSSLRSEIKALALLGGAPVSTGAVTAPAPHRRPAPPAPSDRPRPRRTPPRRLADRARRDRDARRDGVSDHRRGRAVAPARRPALPERHQVHRPRQLRPCAERARVGGRTCSTR